MATSSTLAEDAVVPEAVPAKLPFVPLVLAMLFAVVLALAGVGGATFYLVRSGRLPLQKGVAAAGSPAAPAVPPSAHALVLEPIVANLADAGAATYLKISITLRIADGTAKKDAAAKDEKPAKGMSEAEAAVRDTVLTVLGRQTAEALLAPDGKERLKEQLKAALAEHNPELKVMDVYFIDFLVQR